MTQDELVQHHNNTDCMYRFALGERSWQRCQECCQIALAIGLDHFDPTISTCEGCSRHACIRTGFQFDPQFTPRCYMCGSHVQNWLADCIDCNFFDHPFSKEVLDALDLAELETQEIEKDHCDECDTLSTILQDILPGMHIPCPVHTHVVTEVSST